MNRFAQKLAILCSAAMLLSGGAPVVANPNENEFWLPDFFENGAVSPASQAIRKMKKWGFIDTTGKFVIEPQYDKVEYFARGDTMVRKGKEVFVIDMKGNIIERPSSAGEVIQKRNQQRWAREAKEQADKAKDVYKGDVKNADGTIILGDSSEAEIKAFRSDLAVCKVPKEWIAKLPNQSGSELEREKNCYGYINREGRLVIPPQFCTAEDFSDDTDYQFTANVERWSEKSVPNLMHGSIDKEGKLIGGRLLAKDENVHYWMIHDGFVAAYSKIKGKVLDNHYFLGMDGRKIEGDWQEVYPFSQGLAAVKNRQGLWGFINTQGEQVVPCKFTDVDWRFTNGLCFVKTAEGWGFLNPKAEMVIPPKFADADSFHDGLAAVAIEIPIETKREMLQKAQDFSCGFIDTTGNEVIPGKFYGARRFSEGLAPVSDGLAWGYIDPNGTTVIPFQFDDAYPFRENLAVVRKNNKWGYIDKSGKFAFEPKSPTFWQYTLSRPEDFSEGLGLASEPDFEWNYIDKTGKVPFAIPVPQHAVSKMEGGQFHEGLAVINDDGAPVKHGYIDKKGKWIIRPKFDKAFPFSEGLAAVSDSILKDNQYLDRFGFIEKSDAFKIHPEYDNAGMFKEGLARVSIVRPYKEPEGPKEYSMRTSKHAPGCDYQGKWGFIDRLGNRVINLDYDDARDFSDGLAAVQKDSRWGFLSKLTRKIAIEPTFEHAESFKNGLALVQENGKYGYINKSGAYVIKPTYMLADSFYDDRALFVQPKQQKALNTTQTTYTPMKNDLDMINIMIEQEMGALDIWSGHKD